MASFKLDTDTLGSGAYKTSALDLDTGAFRDIQFEFTQAGLGQDFELHYFEVHLTLVGISKETL